MKNFVDVEAVRAQAAAQWDGSESTRQEFNGDRAAYLALSVAEAKGLVRIHSGGGMSHHSVPGAARLPPAPAQGAAPAAVYSANRLAGAVDYNAAFRRMARQRIAERARLAGAEGIGPWLDGLSETGDMSRRQFYASIGLAVGDDGTCTAVTAVGGGL